ncbi:MAG: serine/threonine protein kinase [Cyanosarcina radialis HA8281-LM2]|jgi:serine/threonine-protein kinase|nr:serine/threonine protein kinase [Cyanosarcina radialis HA8281-LM2]
MQSTLPPETILQKRYRLLKPLGKGGFGVTYLAEDQERFNELCVLKEFQPDAKGDRALNKSKELFYREAAVLYQIDHPQIPKFRASFEQNKRLFLVQDFAEGQTYASLLADRLEIGQTFSEAEAIEFLLQMLPVLEHIHSKGIIHRDIAPDNIILRDRDRLPVLIDFGVVKAGVSQLEAEDNAPQGTTVGKLGYSPTEQLQTGQVYPNSDLYALGVTAVVMMTGRKPEALMDQLTMTWRWHQWVPSLSPWFGKILNRMLSQKPSNRYQSATEVAQALRSIAGLGSIPTSSVFNQPSKSIPPSPVKNTPSSNQVNSQKNSNTHIPSLNRSVVYAQTKNSILDKPWALAAIVGGILLSLTVVPLLLLGVMFPTERLNTSDKKPRTPTREEVVNSPSEVNVNPSQIAISPSPAVVPSPTQVALSPTPLPTASSTTTNPGGFEERLSLLSGQSLAKQGNLKTNQTVTYVVSGQQGQKLNVAIAQGGVLLTILAPNKELLNFQAKQVSRWEGLLPVSGDYYIQLSPLNGVADSNYTIDLLLNMPAAVSNK